MFRFAQPEFLYLLLIVPLILIIYAISMVRRRKLLAKVGDIKLISQLVPDVSPRRGWLKIILLSIAIVCVIVALARPQTGTKMKEMKRKGTEVMICLDVSNSMLAQDFKPNRLEHAKLAISRLVDRLQNDRVGLIVFAGDAYIQLPITVDYVSAKIFLRSISPGIVPLQGTDMGKAINLAISSFSLDSENSRSIIIISDGENHEEGVLEAAKNAAAQGIAIHTVGIGSAKGEVIKLPDGSFMKDRNGDIVVTRLDEKTLQDVAAQTQGIYVAATSTSMGLDKILDHIYALETKELSSLVFDEYREWFMYFLILAIVLIITEFLISRIKNRWLNSIDIFKRKKKK